MIPPGSLPDHPAVRYAAAPPTAIELGALLGRPVNGTPSDVQAARDELSSKRPSPYKGVPATRASSHSNKFSVVPLATKAAREAYAESGGDDARKRLMIVPGCHVMRLQTAQDGNELRVTAIETNQGTVPVPPDGKVIVALGTIESTRLLLVSLPSLPGGASGRIGTNPMAHLRSKSRCPDLARQAGRLARHGDRRSRPQPSFVKGQHPFQDGSLGHFHLQITASGLGALGTNSEAELFKKIPDIEVPSMPIAMLATPTS